LGFLPTPQIGIMGIITPYGTGPSPVYYGSGYLPAVDYWRLGAIFRLIFLAVFMVTSAPEEKIPDLTGNDRHSTGRIRNESKALLPRLCLMPVSVSTS
jgi:hypothetical protein